MNQIFSRFGDVESSVNPDDARSSSQGKGSLKPSGDTCGTVAVEKFKMNSMTGEAKYNQDPSLVLNFSRESKDWTENVCLRVGEWRLDSLEDVGNVGLEGCKAFLNQFEAGRARFL